MTRIGVIGSRKYPDLGVVRAYVRTLPRDTMIVSGGAEGVDHAAEDEARELRLCRLIFEPIAPEGAPRDVYVKALIARNRKIVENCHRLAAFWDGTSTGTAGTFAYARKRGLTVFVFGPDGYRMGP